MKQTNPADEERIREGVREYYGKSLKGMSTSEVSESQ